MTPEEESAYSQGHQRAWLTLLHQVLRELGMDSPEANAAKWAAERAEVVSMLRSLCREFGDNDWDDDLHLADVIDKHLRNHLHENYESNESPDEPDEESA